MQHDQVNIHCPFCHHKGAYPSDPPGSTIRCHECKAIFRMPAVKHRRKGQVLRGEHIKTGSLKRLFLFVLVLAVVGGGVYFAYDYYKTRKKAVEEKKKGDFDNVAGLFPEDKPYGILQRFLESWKRGDLDLLLDYVRKEDRERAKTDDKERDRLKNRFVAKVLVKYTTTGYKAPRRNVMTYQLEVDVKDVQSGLIERGMMKPTVHLEQGDNNTTRWGVDISTAVPKWD